ncbi:MAG: helix-turn-helix domain-containing protein [Chitinispirillales bacterium]|jgi:excisionase family DNA binding protein|nr:helix-turn-helix domain-containing protein [Chitinispirillales bacterium]
MEKMLTCGEIAMRYGVGKHAVWNWIRKGYLPALKLTKRNYRIRQSDLETFEAQRYAAQMSTGYYIVT